MQHHSLSLCLCLLTLFCGWFPTSIVIFYIISPIKQSKEKEKNESFFMEPFLTSGLCVHTRACRENFLFCSGPMNTVHGSLLHLLNLTLTPNLSTLRTSATIMSYYNCGWTQGAQHFCLHYELSSMSFRRSGKISFHFSFIFIFQNIFHVLFSRHNL